LPAKLDLPIFPAITNSPQDPFLAQLNQSGHRWAVLTNGNGDPLLVVDADGFLRAALFEPETFDPYSFCHRPVIFTDENASLNEAILKIKVNRSIDKNFDGVIEHDVLLVWGENKRIITGADIFGRLLKGMLPETLQKKSSEKALEGDKK